jgi:NAD(P) transhydrogenase
MRIRSIWNEVVMNCIELATANSDDMLRQLEFAGVKYTQGLCTFAGKAPNGSTTMAILNEKEGGMQFIRGDNVLIATGSKPFLPSAIPFDGKRIFDSDSINTLSYLPRSIGITGSGIVAVEFAKIFRNLGADVTLIIRDNVPRNALMKIGLDIDIAATLVADLVRSGIKIERGAQVKSFDVPTNTAGRPPIKLTLEAKGGGERPTGTRTEVLCDAYLAAVGRTPNTENLNLDAVGIEMDEYGGIGVGPNLETTASNIYAAGDVLGRPFLASTGLAQGVAAINSMFGQPLKSEECDPNADGEGDNNLCIDGSLGSTGAAFDPTSLAANPFAFPVGVWTSPESGKSFLEFQNVLFGRQICPHILKMCIIVRSLLRSDISASERLGN